jgi:hypothetical protein
MSESEDTFGLDRRNPAPINLFWAFDDDEIKLDRRTADCRTKAYRKQDGKVRIPGQETIDRSQR